MAALLGQRSFSYWRVQREISYRCPQACADLLRRNDVCRGYSRSPV